MHFPIEPSGRQRTVIVANLIEHLWRFSLQALVLIVVKARRREQIGGELDDLVDVAGEHQPRQRDGIARNVDVDRRAQAVEGFVEFGTAAVACAATSEEGGMAM